MKPIYKTTVIQDKGRRPVQEDTVGYRNYKRGRNVSHILIVADGVGGTDRGGNASAFVVQSLLGWYEKGKESLFDKDTDEIIEEVRDEVFWIDERLKSRSKGDRFTYGSTLTMVLTLNSRCAVFQIGDSRAYLKGQGQAFQMEVDQTRYQQCIERGIKIPKGKETKYKSTITQCIGAMDKVPITVVTKSILPDEYAILVSTDGFYTFISQDELNYILDKGRDDEVVLKETIKTVLERGEQDNISCILHRKEYIQ